MTDRTWRSRITGRPSNRTSDDNVQSTDYPTKQVSSSTSLHNRSRQVQHHQNRLAEVSEQWPELYESEQRHNNHNNSIQRENSFSSPIPPLQELRASSLRNPYSSASITSSRRQPEGPVSATRSKALDRTRTAPEKINSNSGTTYPLNKANLSSSSPISQSPSPNSRVLVLRGSSVDKNTSTGSEVVSPDPLTLSASALNWTAKKVDGNSFAVETTNSSENGLHPPMSPTIEMERLNDEPSASSHDVNFKRSPNGAADGDGGSNQTSQSFFSCCCFWKRGRASSGRPRSATNAPPENRTVFITGTHRGFLDNSITTAKYNVLSFLPKFLFEQFRRYSNIFFLFIALMQQIPNVSPTGRFTTAVPLIVIMFVSAIKEMFEDVKRHRADSQVNTTEAEVINRFTGSVVKTKWKDISVGDLVVMKQDQFFPSDLVLISSHEPSGKQMRFLF